MTPTYPSDATTASILLSINRLRPTSTSSIRSYGFHELRIALNRGDPLCLTDSYLLRNHTLFPLLAAFSEDNALQIPSGHLFQKLHPLGRLHPSINPSKFCVQCLNEDLEIHGVAHWHTFHQVPGIEYCYQHDKKLKIICKKCNGWKKNKSPAYFDLQILPSEVCDACKKWRISDVSTTTPAKQSIHHLLKRIFSNSAPELKTNQRKSLLEKLWPALGHRCEFEEIFSYWWGGQDFDEVAHNFVQITKDPTLKPSISGPDFDGKNVYYEIAFMAFTLDVLNDKIKYPTISRR